MKKLKKFFAVWDDASNRAKAVHQASPPDIFAARQSLDIGQQLMTAIECIHTASRRKAEVPPYRYDGLERDTISQAKKAQQASRTVVSNTLNLIRNYKAIGALEHDFGVWKKAVASAGEVSAHKVWDRLLKTGNVEKTLQSYGLHAASLGRIDELLSKNDLRFSIDRKDRLCGKSAGTGNTFVFEDLRAPKLDRCMKDMLSKNRLEVIAEKIGSPGQIAVDVISKRPQLDPDQEQAVNPLNGALVANILLVREMERQLSELEEIGIPEHEGSEIIALVAIYIALIGLLLFALGGAFRGLCLTLGVEEFCLPGQILSILGLLLMSASGFLGGHAASMAGEVGVGIALYGGGFLFLLSTPVVAVIWPGMASGEMGAIPEDEP